MIKILILPTTLMNLLFLLAIIYKKEMYMFIVNQELVEVQL